MSRSVSSSFRFRPFRKTRHRKASHSSILRRTGCKVSQPLVRNRRGWQTIRRLASAQGSFTEYHLKFLLCGLNELVIYTVTLHFRSYKRSDTPEDAVDCRHFAIPGYEGRSSGAIDASAFRRAVRICEEMFGFLSTYECDMRGRHTLHPLS